MLSLKLRREALVVTADPEAADRQVNAPSQEGGVATMSRVIDANGRASEKLVRAGRLASFLVSVLIFCKSRLNSRYAICRAIFNTGRAVCSYSIAAPTS